jgi:hypothetical protein
MAAHLKLDALLGLRPDVAILCECAAPEIAAAKPVYAAASAYQWVGKHRTKGLGVLAFGKYGLERWSPASAPTGEFAIGLRITGGIPLNLLVPRRSDFDLFTPLERVAARRRVDRNDQA